MFDPIQYGTNSKFKSAKKVAITKKTTTAKTITKLKASKKYFVRMRIYTTSNSKKYYGAWSAVKTVTTKK
ncbi:putative carbohydrate-active enzyme [Ruminococcus sp. CAG:579]|nr:putative carbohydrate-active enzyme [Ruminococcus sp. CAG:579]